MHQLSLIIHGILESRGPDCRESTSYVYHYTGHYVYIRKWGYGTLSRMTIPDYMTISKPGIHIHIRFN
jgi:23S rRNA maturation-related 3'-5' exoribonuclease YhaM